MAKDALWWEKLKIISKIPELPMSFLHFHPGPSGNSMWTVKQQCDTSALGFLVWNFTNALPEEPCLHVTYKIILQWFFSECWSSRSIINTTSHTLSLALISAVNGTSHGGVSTEWRTFPVGHSKVLQSQRRMLTNWQMKRLEILLNEPKWLVCVENALGVKNNSRKLGSGARGQEKWLAAE